MGSAQSLCRLDLAGGPNPTPRAGAVGPHLGTWNGEGVSLTPTQLCREGDLAKPNLPLWGERAMTQPQSSCAG